LEIPFLHTTPTINNVDVIHSKRNVGPNKPLPSELMYVPWNDGIYSFIDVYELPTFRSVTYFYTSAYVRAAAFNSIGTQVFIAAYLGITVIKTPDPIYTLVYGKDPIDLAVSPDSTRVYTVGNEDNNVSVLDPANFTWVDSVAVGSQPSSVVITPDGSRLYVSNSGSNNVHVVNTRDLTIAAVITVGLQPTSIVITPDGTTVFVVNSLSDTISVISTQGNTVSTSIKIPVQPDHHPQKVWINPKTGNRLYVSISNTNTLLTVNALTYEVISKTLSVGFNPTGLAFTYSGLTAYSVSATNYTIFAIDTINDVVTPGLRGRWGAATITIGITPY